MAKPITIAKGKPPHESMDYEALRRLGMAHLEQLAGRLWTDFNAHDPAITLLEVLSYAITDLGYKTSWPIQDLLATQKPVLKKQFPTARRVLPCNPVTLLDFRKVLVDVDGIKNAWLEPTQNHYPPFYADRKNSTLTYQTKDPLNEPFDQVLLNGLYQVIFEFEDDGTEENGGLGDLNSNTVEYQFTSFLPELDGLELKLEVSFQVWDAINDKRPLEDFLETISPESTEIRLGDYTVAFNAEVDPAKDPLDWVDAKVYDTSSLDNPEVESLSNDLKQELLEALGFVPTTRYALPVLDKYRSKIALIRDIVRRANQRLHKQRNLCEDFVAFRSLRVEEIGICADVELNTQANVERVQAEIYHAIEQFLSPRIKFYGLEEMFEKGYSSEEIFEGPRLCHGFIDDAEIEQADRRRVIHVSDLIRIIMAIDGVVAVKNIQIANFPKIANPEITQKSVKWCLELAYEQNYVPRLGIDHSRLVFYKDNLPYTGNQDEVENRLEALRNPEGEDTEEKDITLDIPFSQGRKRDSGAYHSIQHHFPQTYGVGDAGLPNSSSKERKALAKQWQGYLLFFEQILADYFAQLHHVSLLFSIDESVDRTYFNQAVREVPGAPQLIESFIKDHEGLKPRERDAAWKDWLDGEDNPYLISLHEITEDEEVFHDRRNRFLDHLMARFNEQFSDYAMLLYSIEGERTQEELIEDKAAMLKHYPKLSHDRGTGFNYANPNKVWDTDNVTGMEQRVGRLLGIDDTTRRHLAAAKSEFIDYYRDMGGLMRWRLLDETGDILLSADKGYGDEEVYDMVTKVLTLGVDLTKDRYYKKKKTSHSKPRHFFNLVDETGDIIARSQQYTTLKVCNAEIERVGEFIRALDATAQFAAEEGLHVIEHPLLRPRSFMDNFLPICAEEDCEECLDTDPYSFRISVVLPAYAYRFRNMDFRKFVEKTIRLETPAHILARICWIAPDQMAEFEVVYKAWLEELAEASTTNFDQPVSDINFRWQTIQMMWRQRIRDEGGTPDQATLDTWREEAKQSFLATRALYREGEFINAVLLLQATIPTDPLPDADRAEFKAAATELRAILKRILQLEAMLHYMAETNDYDLGQAIRYDDVRKLEPILMEDPDEELKYDDLLEKLQDEVKVVFEDSPVGDTLRANPYQELVAESFTKYYAEIEHLADLTPEPLERDRLHQEMLHLAYYTEFTEQLADMEIKLDVTTAITAEELKTLSSLAQAIVLNSAILQDQLRQFRLTLCQNELLVVLMSLRNVYPSATLHDCEESDTSQRPVSLDNTILGSFTPTVTPDNDGTDL